MSRGAPVVRRRMIVRGRVQGVWFRESTRRVAELHGVGGSVRNLPDGGVEVVLEGPPQAVERVIEFCRVGPPDARVDAVEVVAEPPTAPEGFVVL